MKTVYHVRVKIAPKDSPSTFFEKDYVVDSYERAQIITRAAEKLGGRASCIPHTIVLPADVVREMERLREGY